MEIRIYLKDGSGVELLNVHSITDSGNNLYFSFIDGKEPKKMDKRIAYDMIVKWHKIKKNG